MKMLIVNLSLLLALIYNCFNCLIDEESHTRLGNSENMIVLLSSYLVNLKYSCHLSQPTVDTIHTNMKSFTVKIINLIKVGTFKII